MEDLMIDREIENRIWSATAGEIVAVAGEVLSDATGKSFYLVSGEQEIKAAHYNMLLKSDNGGMLQVIARRGRYKLTSVSVYGSRSVGGPVAWLEIRDGDDGIIVRHNNAQFKLPIGGTADAVADFVNGVADTALKSVTADVAN